MGQYSIKNLEEITGIKAHTIRIWEKRYNIVTPQRTDTNIRYYTDADLKKLLSVSTLNDYGFKISHIALMTNSQISKEINNLSQAEGGEQAVIESLKVAMIEYNEALFNKVFSEQIEQKGIEKAIIEIIYPFFEKVGMLWLSGTINPAQEHFVSNLLRQKLYSILEKTTTGKKSTVLAFLFEGEWHDLGLMFYTVLLKLKGHKVIYLGQSVPAIDVKHALEQIQPSHALTSIISTDGINYFQDELNKLAKSYPKISFIISGATSKRLNFKKFPKNVIQKIKSSDLNSI